MDANTPDDIGTKYDSAINEFTEAIRIDPQNATAYFKRAISHQEMGNQEQADADYAEAIRLDPSLAAKEE